MIWIQFAILLAAILIGSQMKGIGLGVMGMVALLIFILVFQMRPTDPPLDVMLIILSIVTTAASLQAAGGLDYLVGVAEKIIRSKPSQIVFIGPFTVFFLCLFAGTAHIVYSLLPIISEVSARKRIRPERALSMSVIASHLALTSSPMSAATAAMTAILVYPGAQKNILMVCIPASLIGVFVGCLSVLKMGKDLDKDPEFQKKMLDPVFAADIDRDSGAVEKTYKPGAKISVAIFGFAILLIIIAGAFPQLVPSYGAGESNFSITENGTLRMGTIIEIVTLSAAAAIMLITKTSAVEVTKASLFNSMASAVVSVFGVVWMAATFMDHNEATIKHALGDITTHHPWTFAIALFIMGMLTFSQAATTKTMMPLGVVLGIPAPQLIAMFPAVNSDFVLPGYPTLLAAINFDKTGSTHIGKFVVNHSFIRGGLITLAVSIALGFLFASLLL